MNTWTIILGAVIFCEYTVLLVCRYKKQKNDIVKIVIQRDDYTFGILGEIVDVKNYIWKCRKFGLSSAYIF
jgi:hypothetical protein